MSKKKNKFYPFRSEIEYIVHLACQAWDHDYSSHVRIAESASMGYFMEELVERKGRIKQKHYVPVFQGPREVWLKQIEEMIAALFSHPDIEANWRNLEIYPKERCTCKGCQFRRKIATSIV